MIFLKQVFRGIDYSYWRFPAFVIVMFAVLFLPVDAPETVEEYHAVVTPDSGEMFVTLTDEERAWLRDHPVIRVVQAPDWPPVEFSDKHGEPSGMSEDYLRLIEQRLGIKFERVRGLSWQEAYARLARWEIDMTTSVTGTPERTEFWAFTRPYMEIPNVIFADANVTYIADMRELAGKVAVAEGYAASEWIPNDYPEIQLVQVSNVQEGLEKVQRGEVSAYVGDMLVGGYYLAELKMTTLKIAGNTPYVNIQSMAVRKDWAPLAGILDKALDSISETERNDIYRKWLPIRYEYGFDYTGLWWALGIFSAILFLVGFWIWRLTREIEARKRAETISIESTSRFKQLFQIAPMPLGLINKLGALTDVNDQWMLTFGYLLEEIPTINEWQQLVYPDHEYRRWAIETWGTAVLRAQENKTSIEPIDYRVTCKNGDERIMQISGAFLGEDLLAVFFDITDLKRSEEEQQRYIRELETIYRASSALQHLHTPENLAQELIAVMEHTLSFEYGAVLLLDESNGSLVPFALSGHGMGTDLLQKEKAHFMAQYLSVDKGIIGWVVTNGQSVRLGDVRSDPRYLALWDDVRSELCVPLQAGDRIIGALNLETTRANAFNESDQRLLETIATQMALAVQQTRLLEQIWQHTGELEQRVAERTVQLEEKIEKLNQSQEAMLYMVEDLNSLTAVLKDEQRKLLISNQELEAFTYSVSHDLRAPLRAVDGYGKFLLEDYGDTLDAEGKRFIHVIRENAARMDRLILDLLNLSRISRADLNLTPVNMSEIVESIFYEIASNDEKVSFEMIISKMPPVMCDITLIKKVWHNLISNAIKYSSKSKIKKIEISAIEEQEQVVFSIKDHGAGFNEKYKEKLFGIFQRLHADEEFKGNGVGLVIVQRIIHRHGGTVWAKGKINQGAEFYFTLPR